MLKQADREVLAEILDYAWTGKVRYFPSLDGNIYRPGRGQRHFNNSNAWARGLFGGRGSGKTTAGAQEAVRKISQGQPGIVANPDFENLKTSTWPALKPWIPWHHVHPHDHRMMASHWEPSKPFYIHFTNGAWILVKGFKDANSARGPNVNWLWYDEPGRDKTGESFKVAAASVRIGADPKVWVTGTPVGVRHWLYNYFVLQEFPDEVGQLLEELGFTGQLVDYSHASIEENKYNLSPFFYASMKSLYQGKFAQQELEGLFLEVSEGVVFDTFTKDNITDMEPVPGHPIELAFDQGYVDPRVILFIQKFPDKVLVFDEYRRTREMSDTAVKNVVARINSWPWAIQNKKDEDGKVLADTIDRFYLRLPNTRWKWPKGKPHIKDEATIKAFIMDQVEQSKKKKEDPEGKLVHLPVEMAVGSPEAKELHRYFRKADIKVRVKPHKIIDGIEKVRGIISDDNEMRVLQVHSRCRGLLGEVTEGYRYPEGDRRDNENPLDKDDHGPEALRHWVNLRIK